MSRSPLYRGLLRALSRARRENLAAAGRPPPVPGAVRGWTRRRFVASTGLAVPALVWGPGLPAREPPPDPAYRVAVVGGGLAGLNAAWRLMQAGVQVALYEGSPRLGGRVMTRKGVLGEGLVSELGGEFVNSDHADLIGLARDLGLRMYNRAEAPATLTYPSAAYYFGGRRRTEGELASLLRPLAGQIAADAARLDRDPEAALAELDALSVAGYLDRHAGLIPEPFVRALIEASIRSEYGVEPDRSSAVQLLDNLPRVDGQQVEILGASDEAYGIQGGNGQVVAGLAAALGERIQTGRRLVAIGAPPGGPVELRFGDGPPAVVDQAVLAMPFNLLRAVAIEGELSPTLRRAIAELDPGRNEKLLAGFARRAWHAPGGFAVEAWTDLGFAEVWDATLDRAGEGGGRADGVLSFFPGGDEVTAAWGQRDAQAHGRTFVERLDGPVPGLLDAATGRYAASGWTASPWSLGAYVNLKPGQIGGFASVRWVDSPDPRERQEVRAGPLVFAGEHLSDDYGGFMNGAVQTGRLAAESVLRHLATVPSG